MLKIASRIELTGSYASHCCFVCLAFSLEVAFEAGGIMNQAGMRAAILLALLWVAFCRPAFAECGFAGTYTPESQPAHSTQFRNKDISGAHRSLPPGSRVVVRSQRKGRSIIVRIIDRGLFGFGQIINLSAGAIQALGM